MQPVLFDSEEWAQIIEEWIDAGICTGEEDGIKSFFQYIKRQYEEARIQREVDFFESIREKAEQGDSIAQYKLGECYADGYGCPSDMEEAVRWWHKAAEQELDSAQYCLGMYYYHTKFFEEGTDDYLDYAEEWLTKAARRGHRKAIYQLLHSNCLDHLPLHVGLINNEKIEYFEHCLNSGININEQDGIGRTPLIFAVYLRNLEVCRLLLERGADIHISCENNQHTAFDYVIVRWDRNIADLFLDAGVDIEEPDDGGNRLLHWVAEYYSIEAMEWLLAHGAKTNIKNEEGFLPIDVAGTREKRRILAIHMGIWDLVYGTYESVDDKMDILREAESKRAEDLMIPF